VFEGEVNGKNIFSMFSESCISFFENFKVEAGVTSVARLTSLKFND
jgi:hypothetical protein